MFKLALALCVVAAAAVDTEAPIINMDLVNTGMTCTRPASGVADSAAGVTDTIDTCVETCQGVPAGTSPACTRPTISAFDHHDGDLTDVIQFKTEFNSAGFNDMQTLDSSSDTSHVFSAIDFAVCGKYTVSLEVSDAAGNAASTNEATDTLIIKVEDTTPPVITVWTNSWTKEAACVCGDADHTSTSDMSVTFTTDNTTAVCTDELAPTDRAITYTRTTVELCPRHSDFDAAATNTGTCHDDGAACLTDDSQPDNVASATQTFAIADTTPPTCVITPPLGQSDDTVIQECGYDYNFCGSTVNNEAKVCEVSCIDAVSQPCGHNHAQGFDAITVAKVFNFDKSTVGTDYSVAYTPTDQALNVGITETRAIHVVDTQAPVLSTDDTGTTECKDTTDDTTSCATHKLCHALAACAEVVVTCNDHCDTNPTLVSSWNEVLGDGSLNTASAVTGRYIKEYTCTDASDNVESRTVIYDVYPKGIPTLNLISNSAPQNHWEATNTGAYTDSGATASDGITGDLYTHLIRTSGDIVNLAVEGTYLITYMVTNPHTVNGGTPETASAVRTVLVSDDTCPVATTVVDSCAVGWTLYNDKCYKKGDSAVQWAAARTACEAEGTSLAPAFLVTINSNATNAFVHELCGGDKCWIGGNDLSNERGSNTDGWQWHSGESHGYQNFKDGEPNNAGDNNGEDCVHMWDTGLWNDNGCGIEGNNNGGGKEYNYVCEKQNAEIIEAGFPYVDDPITFSDSMDGTISTVSTGTGIVGGAMFLAGGNPNYMGNTDGHCPASTSNTATRKTISGVDCICFNGNTFVANPATEPLIGNPNYSVDCEAQGMITPTATEIENLRSEAYSQYHARTHEDVDPQYEAGDTHIMSPCMVKKADDSSHLVFLKDTTSEVTHTQGNYVITYSATDAAGNGDECPKPERTIIVQDTLPPVITLHDDGEKQAKGADESNPAWHYNPFSLMAEQTSVNGWMVGAVASFVAGVALVSFSSKSESYSVPV